MKGIEENHSPVLILDDTNLDFLPQISVTTSKMSKIVSLNGVTFTKKECCLKKWSQKAVLKRSMIDHYE